MANSKSITSALSDEVDKLRSRALETSRKIHASAETRFVEYESSRILQEWLAEEGFEVEAAAADLPTAFTATWGGGAPRVALMAEYDALPTIGHGCGHNLIGAGAATAAIALRRVLPEDFSGTLMVIGTPGEESGGGKVIELERGLFDDVDAAMMFHPSDRTVLNRRMLARIHYRVNFHGVASHASKNPERGRNALSAMVFFFNGIDALRQHIGARMRVHGIITNGGSSPNTIPDFTQAEIYVRAGALEEAQALAKRVEDCANGAALMSGTRAEVEQASPTYAELRSNAPMVDRIASHLSSLNIPTERATGDEATGSTDAGNVSLALPTIHPFIKIGPEGTPSHSVEMREAALSPEGEEAMLKAATALAATAFDLLTEPEFMRASQQAFDAAQAGS